jgi:hypothetical protein
VPAAGHPSEDLVPELVTLDVWGVGRAGVPSALRAVALDRRGLQRSAGLTFGKLLGTGDGRTLSVRDADLRHWAVLACWADERALAAYDRSDWVRRWEERVAASPDGERLTVTMRPLASRGRWDGRAPFGDPGRTEPTPQTPPTATDPPHSGPVAALTRATLRARTAAEFWRSVPAVTRRLRTADGLLLSLGIGERPVGRQGTFSLWRTAEALEAFAYGTSEHRDVVRRTPQVRWYREELFARLAVLRVTGSLGGRTVEPFA